MRITRFCFVLAAIVGLSVGFGLLAPLPTSADDAGFQQFRGTAEHGDHEFRHGFNESAIATRWAYNPVGDGLPGGFRQNSQPCVSADSQFVFAVGGVDSTSSKIIAVNVETGNKAWELTVPSHNAFGSSSSPVFHRGYVYWVGSNGAGTTSAFRIRAADGSTATADGGWQVTLPFTADVVNCSAMIADCRLFVSLYAGFGTPGNGKTLALRLADGSIEWVVAEGGEGQGSPGWVPAHDLVVQSIYDPVASADAGDDRFRVRAYEAATGAVRWTTGFVLRYKYNPHAAVVHRDNRLYLISTDFASTRLYSIVANSGALDWSADISLSSTGVPAVDPDGNVYICGENFGGTNQTFAFDATGTAIAAWSGNGTNKGSNGNSVTWADGRVLIGNTSNSLSILDDADGTEITTIAGHGPVAFGFNLIASIDTNGVLQAHTCGALFAGTVVRYTQGSSNTPTFNDPTTALGRPTTVTDGNLDTVPVHGATPAAQTDEIVSIGVGGELVLKLDQPASDDPANPFGIDFIVFGNAFMGAGGAAYGDQTDPTGFTLDGTIFTEPATVEVSEDGVNWVTIASPTADNFAPTLGRVYDEGNPDTTTLAAWNQWWSATETDANLPLDPSISAADFNGQTIAQMAQAYGQSAGGTGYDISGTGLARVRYVRITTNAVDAGSASEIDAVAIVRPAATDSTAPPVITNLTATITNGSASVSFSMPSDKDAREVIVTRSIGAAGVAPTDGIHYCTGHVLGTAVIVYAGPLTQFSETGVGTSPLPTYTVYTVDRALNHSSGVSVVAVIGTTTSGGGDTGGCAAGGSGGGMSPVVLLVLLLGLLVVRRRVG